MKKIVQENNATKLPDGTWKFRAKAVLVDGDEVTGILQIENGEMRIEKYARYLENGRVVIVRKGVKVVIYRTHLKYNLNGQAVK